VCLTRALLSLGNIQPLTAWQADPSLLSTADPVHRAQSWWAERVHLQVKAHLETTLPDKEAVRFASQTLPHAMSWVAVVPAEALRTLIPSVDFKCLLRFHLGIPLTPSVPSSCPRCESALDCSGNHLVCCVKNGLTQRHGAVQDTVFRLVQQAGFTARKEQAAPDRTRPGDVFISRLDSNGPAAVDITIRHTLAPSRPVRKAADVEPWLEAQEREKTTKYLPQCRRLGWAMIPFVVDCFGGLGREARSLMGTCLRMILGQRELWARRSAEAEVWQTLSVSVAKEVGKQLRLSRYVTEDAMEVEGDGSSPSTHNPYA
jgi:hypothetical protein